MRTGSYLGKSACIMLLFSGQLMIYDVVRKRRHESAMRLVISLLSQLFQGLRSLGVGSPLLPETVSSKILVLVDLYPFNSGQKLPIIRLYGA